MKKFKILGVALLTVIAVCVFFACGSDSNGGGDSSLVGTWIRQNTTGKTVKVIVNSNGTGKEIRTYTDYSYDTHIEEFKWKTSGNKLYLTYTFDDSYSYEEDETDVFTYTLDGDYLYLVKEYDGDSYYSGSGKTYVYKREK